MVFKVVDNNLTTVFNKVQSVSNGFDLASSNIENFVDGFNRLNSQQNFGSRWESFLDGASSLNSNVSLYFQELAKQGSSAKASVEGVYAAILDGNTKGFANVKSTMTLFNQAQQSGADNAQAFAKAVSQSNTQLGGYLSTLDNGKASLKGYTGYLVTTTVKTIGLRLATAALNAVAGGLISAVAGFILSGINEAITGFSNLIHNVSDTKEKVEELTNEFNTAITTANNNANRIEELIEKYSQLSKGVNNLGENVSLTNTEYEEYTSLTNEIADMFPNLIQGYDNEGNAILGLKGNVEQLRDAYKEAQKEAYNLLIATGKDSDGNDIIKQWQDTQDTNFLARLFGDNEVGEKLSISEAVDLLNTFNNMDFSRFRELPTLVSGAVEEVNGLKPLTDDELSMAYSGFVRDKLGITDWNISEEDFANAKKQAKALIQTYNAEIEAALSDVKTLANAYLMTNDDYDKLDEQSKTTASIIVNSLDENVADAFEDKTDVGQYVNKIIKSFDDINVQKAANGLFTLDTSSMSVGEIISEVDKYIDIIANAIGEDSDKLKIRLEFDDIDDTLERAKRKFQTGITFGSVPSDVYNAQINSFLENLSLDDLDIAMQISDLFADGLSKASEKIQEFKSNPNNNPISFDYSIYSEQVEDIAKNIDNVQSALDKLNDGKIVDNNDIIKLANAFPDYSTKILASSNDTEKLRDVLTEIKTSAPRSLINTLENLKNLSEDDQEAVNGLIAVLQRCGDTITEEQTKTLSNYTKELSNTKSIVDDIKEKLDNNETLTANDLQKALEQYPQLEDSLSQYLSGLKSQEDIYAELKKYYNQDLENFKTYLVEKSMNDENSWTKFVNNNGTWVQSLADMYALDLANLTTYKQMSDAIKNSITNNIPDTAAAFQTNLIAQAELLERYKGLFGNLDNVEDIIDSSSSKSSTSSLPEAYAKAKKELEHIYNMGEISTKEYYIRLNKLAEQWLKGNENYLDEYRSVQESVYSGLKSLYSDEVNAQIEGYENVLDVLKNINQEKIDSLNKEKEALQNNADEEQRILDLKQAQLDLENAKKKTNWVITEQGLKQVQDTKAVDEAQQALDKLELESKTAQIDKKIELLENENDKYDKIKTDWQTKVNLENAKKFIGSDNIKDAVTDGFKEGYQSALNEKENLDNLDKNGHSDDNTYNYDKFLKHLGSPYSFEQAKEIFKKSDYMATFSSSYADKIKAMTNNVVNNTANTNNNSTFGDINIVINDATDPEKVGNIVVKKIKHIAEMWNNKPKNAAFM